MAVLTFQQQDHNEIRYQVIHKCFPCIYGVSLSVFSPTVIVSLLSLYQSPAVCIIKPLSLYSQTLNGFL